MHNLFLGGFPRLRFLWYHDNGTGRGRHTLSYYTCSFKGFYFFLYPPVMLKCQCVWPWANRGAVSRVDVHCNQLCPTNILIPFGENFGVLLTERIKGGPRAGCNVSILQVHSSRSRNIRWRCNESIIQRNGMIGSLYLACFLRGMWFRGPHIISVSSSWSARACTSTSTAVSWAKPTTLSLPKYWEYMLRLVNANGIQLGANDSFGLFTYDHATCILGKSLRNP